MKKSLITSAVLLVILGCTLLMPQSYQQNFPGVGFFFNINSNTYFASATPGTDWAVQVNNCGGQVLLNSVNGALITTTLNGAITNIATAITVVSGSNFQNGNYVVVDSEIILIQDGARATPSVNWTVARGQLGTTAVAHSSGATVAVPLGGICQCGGIKGAQTTTTNLDLPNNVEFIFAEIKGTINPGAGNAMIIVGSNSQIYGIGSGVNPAVQTLFQTTQAGAFGICMAGSNGTGVTSTTTGIGCVISRDAGPANNDPTVQSIIIQNITLQGAGSGVSTTSGLKITGMTNSLIQANTFQGWNWGMDCGDLDNDGGAAVNTLYDNFVQNRFISNGIHSRYRRVCNALRHFGNRYGSGGTSAILIGDNTLDAYAPDEVNFQGGTIESITTAIDSEMTQGGVVFRDGRIEAVTNAVNLGTNCKTRGLILDGTFMASTVTNWRSGGACPGLVFKNIYPSQLATSYGFKTPDAVNVLVDGGFEARQGTTSFTYWGSIASATPTVWPSGTAVVVNQAAPLLQGATTFLNTSNGKCGDAGGTVSGCFNNQTFPIDPAYQYTLGWWATANNNATTFTPCFRFFDRTGAAVTTTIPSILFGNYIFPLGTSATESTGSLTYNRANYVANCYSATPVTVTTGNTWQHYWMSFYPPQGISVVAGQLGFLVLTSGTNVGFFDEASLSAGATAAVQPMQVGLNPYGIISAQGFGTLLDCNSTGGTCSNATSGSVGITNPATTVTVSTTAVQANSKIFVQEDATLGTKLGATCNNTAGRTYLVTTRTAGTSFIITASATPAANTACLNWWILQ